MSVKALFQQQRAALEGLESHMGWCPPKPPLALNWKIGPQDAGYLWPESEWTLFWRADAVVKPLLLITIALAVRWFLV